MLLSTTRLQEPIIEPVTLAQLKNQMRVDTGMTLDDSLCNAAITAARVYAEEYTRRVFFNQTLMRTMDHFPSIYFYSSTVNPSMKRDWPYYAGPWYNLTIALPYPRLINPSAIQITYVDMSGNVQSLNSNTYTADANSEPARLAPLPAGVWPFDQFYLPGSVKITYQAASYVNEVSENVSIPASSPYTYTPLQSPVTGLQGATDSSGNAVACTYSATTGNVTFSAANEGDTVTLTYYVANLPMPLYQAILWLAADIYKNREATSQSNLFEIPFGVKAMLDMYTVNVLDYDSVV